MGVLKEKFRGNPNKFDEDDDDEIEYFLDDEENMFGPQYTPLDFLNSIDTDVEDDDDDDDDIYIPEAYTDSEDDITDLDVIMDSDVDSEDENDEEENSHESDNESSAVDKKTNNDAKTSENLESNSSQA